jgi:Protein of unknown function (DUF5672)
MLDLPDVTLVLADTVCHELSAMAVEDCLAVASFGDVLVFSDKEILPDRTRIIAPLDSIPAWTRFMWCEVHKHVRTGHILIIQWDSWILDTDMWRSEFLSYDYVGAPWLGSSCVVRVGNSGFSLRSKRLMDYLAANLEPPDDLDDKWICVEHRDQLEKAGFTWAPEEVAWDFSLELSHAGWSGRVHSWEGRHFGFHGVQNFEFVASGERLERRKRLMDASSYVQGRRSFLGR